MIRFFKEPILECELTSAKDTGDAGRLRFNDEYECCKRIILELLSSIGVIPSSVLVIVPRFSRNSFNICCNFPSAGARGGGKGVIHRIRTSLGHHSHENK